MLAGKTVVVGVCGGIAAYKAVEVVSRLRQLGATVHVIMTRSATHFVAPLTFQTISGNPVVVDLFAGPTRWNVEHVALAEQANLLLVVPATANVVGKVASGIADDFLTTAIMASAAPVVFSPSMNHRMYENPIFQSNVRRLERLGYHFIPAASGPLACGAVGVGRLPDPQVIVDAVVDLLQRRTDSPPGRGGGSLSGRRVLVTAGPTREAIDPVRFLSNPSSGKMGFALAEAAARRGARVTLVSGPAHLPDPPGVEVVRVVSAEEMFQEVIGRFSDVDLVLKAAAVSDFRPVGVSSRKVKKEDLSHLTLELERTPDILATLGMRKERQILVGFAAETHDIDAQAASKLRRKNLDLLVLNDVTQPGAGFESDTNRVRLYWPDGRREELPLMKKSDLAHLILDRVLPLLPAGEPG